jgi:hypothetical protein
MAVLGMSCRAILGITCPGPRPDAWLAGRQAIIVTPNPDGSFYAGIDLASRECDHFVDFLEQAGRIPRSFSFSLYEGEDWWKEPDDSWVAARLLSDDFVHVSSVNTFDPACPPPCYGLVPPHLPLHVLGRPRAPVVGVKFEDIFSERMAAFLVSLVPCQLGKVLLDNQVLQSHLRLFPQVSRKVLATETMRNVRGGCAVCGSKNLASAGQKLGRRVDDLVVCRNEEGVGHLAAEHPIIVSIAVAQELRERFPRGYGMDPILDVDSPCGQRILHLFRRLQRLEGFRETNGVKHT